MLILAFCCWCKDIAPLRCGRRLGGWTDSGWWGEGRQLSSAEQRTGVSGRGLTEEHRKEVDELFNIPSTILFSSSCSSFCTVSTFPCFFSRPSRIESAAGNVDSSVADGCWSNSERCDLTLDKWNNSYMNYKLNWLLLVSRCSGWGRCWKPLCHSFICSQEAQMAAERGVMDLIHSVKTR